MSCKYSIFCKKKNEQCDTSLCPRYFKIDKLCEDALLTEKQREDTPLYADNIDGKVFSELAEYRSLIYHNVKDGNSIFICSTNTGNGKTTWSIKLLISYICRVWAGADIEKHYALFINVPRYFNMLKSSFSGNEKAVEFVKSVDERIYDADVVVFDDIATKNCTEFEMENLLSIIDTRIDYGKCNIFTSNIMPNQLTDVVGARLSSRINGSKKFIFNSKDRRVEQ